MTTTVLVVGTPPVSIRPLFRPLSLLLLVTAAVRRGAVSSSFLLLFLRFLFLSIFLPVLLFFIVSLGQLSLGCQALVRLGLLGEEGDGLDGRQF